MSLICFHYFLIFIFQSIYWSLCPFRLGSLPTSTSLFLSLGTIPPPHPPVLGFSEIACSSLFSLPTLRFSIPELSIMVATSHNLHRDVIASKESTDFILKARAGIAGIADTWSRRLRLTILGIRRGTRRSKWPRFNLLVAVTRLYMIICGPVYG